MDAKARILDVVARNGADARKTAETSGFESMVPRARAALQALAWLVVAAALGGTFWLYTRPNLLLEIGSFLMLCGFPQ
jgi:hypothetical protein